MKKNSQLDVRSIFPELSSSSLLHDLQISPSLSLEVLVHPSCHIGLNTILQPNLVENGRRFVREPCSNETEEERKLRMVAEVGTGGEDVVKSLFKRPKQQRTRKKRKVSEMRTPCRVE